MTERYPDDATLLTLKQDAATGVEYIPTGKSPYHLDFRKLLYRLLRAAERANDFRVYQDGSLSIGVRPGRCYINDGVVDFGGAAGLSLNTNQTHSVWLDDTGQIQTDVTGFPADRRTFVPLATVTTDSTAIQSITDCRGEAFLQLPTLATLGVDATAAEINQALDGIGPTVTPTRLDIVTEGSQTTADSLHRHETFEQVVAGEAHFTLKNSAADAAANMVFRMRLPTPLAHDAELLVNTDTGYFTQRYNGQAYELVGTVHEQFHHAGTLTSSSSGELVGAVPISGHVSDVIVSVGTNMESTDSGDGLQVTPYVNGAALTSTDPAITAAAGGGFRCTGQGDGTSAVMKTDGTEAVTRGDLLTLDLTRTANGSISTELVDIVVLVVIRPNRPE